MKCYLTFCWSFLKVSNEPFNCRSLYGGFLSSFQEGQVVQYWCAALLSVVVQVAFFCFQSNISKLFTKNMCVVLNLCNFIPCACFVLLNMNVRTHRKLWLVDFLCKCFSETLLSASASSSRALCLRGFSVSTAGHSPAAAQRERRRQVCCLASRCISGLRRWFGCCWISSCCRVRTHGERGRLL